MEPDKDLVLCGSPKETSTLASGMRIRLLDREFMCSLMERDMRAIWLII